MEANVDRQRLASMQKRVLRAGSAFEAEVALYSDATDSIVVKDCSCMAPAIRLLFGRRVKRREINTYRHLAGVEGVPAFLGRIDRNAFAMEYIEGKTIARDLEKDRLEKAMASLERVLENLHARRVVHLDLKQKRNVIVRSDGSVAIIDFESAFRIPDHFLGDLILNRLKRRDRAGLIKFKAKYAPHLLAPEESAIRRRERLLGILWPFKRIVRLFRGLFRSS